MLQDDQEALDWYIAGATKRGYRIVSRTNEGVQLIKPKQWSVIGLALFVLLPAIGGLFWTPLWYLALVGGIGLVLHYITREDQLEYVTVEQARLWMSRASPN